jgi:hypothetical protein
MPFNVTGTPAIAVPNGFSDGGLPLGMQIATKAFDKAMLYRIAHVFCAATGLTKRRPPALLSADTFPSHDPERPMPTLPRERLAYSSPFHRPPLKLPGKGRIVHMVGDEIMDWYAGQVQKPGK